MAEFERLTESELNELANSPIWEHERLVGTGNQVKSLAAEVRRYRAEREPVGDDVIDGLMKMGKPGSVFCQAAENIRGLREALAKFGKHDKGCHEYLFPGVSTVGCDCGFDAALKGGG